MAATGRARLGIRGHACRLLLWCCLLAGSRPALAAAPGPIALHHTGWTARDGAPAMVLTMAQTRDGWLWLGSPNGLFRFDGVRFERYADTPLPANSISILSAQPGGDLWIGYRFGGASHLSQGRLRNYDERDGLPRTVPVWGVEHDASGRIWAATALGMFYLQDERWHAAGSAWGLDGAIYKTLMLDRNGTLWAQAEGGIYALARGATRFIRAAADNGLGVVTEVADGSVWSWDARNNRLNRLTAPANGASPRQWQLHGGIGAILFDRAGDLWAGRQSGVEYHSARGVRATGPQQGLTGGAVTALMEDREGNVWVATAYGIDRFRARRVAPVINPDNPGPQALTADDDGGVWSGRFHVARPHDGTAAASALWPASSIFWRNQHLYSYRDPAGTLWIGGYGGLFRKDGARIASVPLPNGMEGANFAGMVCDRAGRLWITLALHGVFRLEAGGAWTRMDGRDGLPDEPARAIAIDQRGDLWLAYPRNRVLQQRGQGWHSYGAADGIALGMVLTVYAHGAHLWAGGENGLALRHGERFISVAGSDGQSFGGINTILELPNGDVWVNAVSGLFRLPASEIAAVLATPGYRVHYEKLDSSDGLDGAAPFTSPKPTLALASDGQLWLATTAGIFRFDPAARAPAQAPPPVLIRKLGAAGQLHAATAGTILPPGTGALQIDYTAMAFAMPERIRFRYRLEGVDSHWQDAAHRRVAYYNNLGAGDYRFQVQASNDQGLWDDGAATLEFSIAPTITQTWWFKCLCMLAVLAACWLAYRLRLRRLMTQLAVRMEERLDERERIARELHDTLLQSVQGLILNVHAASMRLPEPEPARAMIEQALQRADDVLHEGRDRVRGLRRTDSGEQDLGGALAEFAAHARPPQSMPMQLVVQGQVRRLHPAVQQEVLAIACEAILNAFRHAQAALIETRLDYDARELRVSVRDDGRGIPAAVLAAGGRANHWGMPGMRERAQRLQARLTVHSTPGVGTEWLLALPGRLAYQARPSLVPSFRRKPSSDSHDF